MHGPQGIIECFGIRSMVIFELSTCRQQQQQAAQPSQDSSSSEAPLGLGLNRGHYHVRLTGQDVERGTFKQRHAVLLDQQSGTCVWSSTYHVNICILPCPACSKVSVPISLLAHTWVSAHYFHGRT